jgi:hypothetical protein
MIYLNETYFYNIKSINNRKKNIRMIRKKNKVCRRVWKVIKIFPALEILYLCDDKAEIVQSFLKK